MMKGKIFEYVVVKWVECWAERKVLPSLVDSFKAFINQLMGNTESQVLHHSLVMQ